VIYQGRNLDVVSLWSEFVDLPSNLGDSLPTFLDKVKCPNPEHDTHKRHFQINTRKPLVHCFAECGISGSYERAISMIVGCTEKEARRLILEHTRVALGKDIASAYAGTGTRKSFSKDDPVAKDERALRSGEFQFLPREVRNYLDSRGIDESSRSKWELGWSEEDERLVIPAYDERGTFRFLIKRALRDSSLKYLYTDGAIKTSLLFGACHIDSKWLESSDLVLCEGSLDVIRLHQLGITNAVAVLGSGISRKQLRLIDKLGPRRIVLMFDKDSAGVHNIGDAKRKLRKWPLLVVRYPKHRSDPAEMTREEVERAIDRALPIHKFYAKARQRSKLIREVVG